MQPVKVPVLCIITLFQSRGNLRQSPESSYYNCRNSSVRHNFREIIGSCTHYYKRHTAICFIMSNQFSGIVLKRLVVISRILYKRIDEGHQDSDS